MAKMAHSAESVAAWEGLTPPYQTIVADPPWRYKKDLVVTGNAPGRTRRIRGSGTPYSTLTVEEIRSLPVGELADRRAHLYLWTTNTHLEYAWGIARQWGFTPKTLLTWCKAPKGMIGFGTFSLASEFVLFAERGGKAINVGRSDRTWFQWARGAHSQKPAGFLDLVESVSPSPYVELFARSPRLGWDSWGYGYEVAV